MPEGDSAFRVAANLRNTLVGHALTQFELRTSRYATADLRGHSVSEIDTYGKHMIVRIGAHSLHSHMRMDGTWHIYRSGARWRRPAHQARIVLGTSANQVVGFLICDIALIDTADEHRLIGHLGPDPLNPQWRRGGREIAAANVQADPRPVHVAILDQRNVAGFGNEYANEMCYLAGIDPSTPGSGIDAMALMMLGERLIRANVGRVERTTTGNLRPGKRLHVFGRAGRPCRRCGETIRFTRLGSDPTRARHVYWCPTCQPAP